MYDLKFMATVSSVLTLWLFSSMCLVKIALTRRYSLIYIIMAFIPPLQLFVVAKIVNAYCTDLLGNIFVIGILSSFLQAALNSGIEEIMSNISDNTYHMLKFISIQIFYLPPSWYIWRKIAKEGKHKRPDLLGILTGISIIEPFAAFYITWKGEW